jgi:hypothetical protein
MFTTYGSVARGSYETWIVEEVDCRQASGFRRLALGCFRRAACGGPGPGDAEGRYRLHSRRDSDLCLPAPHTYPSRVDAGGRFAGLHRRFCDGIPAQHDRTGRSGAVRFEEDDRIRNKLHQRRCDEPAASGFPSSSSEKRESRKARFRPGKAKRRRHTCLGLRAIAGIARPSPG